MDKKSISPIQLIWLLWKSVWNRIPPPVKEVNLKTWQFVITPVFSIPRGGEYDLTLSDGSRLWMNSESEIRIPVQFSKEQRDVYMKGEIYFDIAPDAQHPFVVHTHQGNIRVVGTSFNVESLSR